MHKCILTPLPIWPTIANDGHCTGMCDVTGAWHADSLQNRPHERHRMAKEAAGSCEDTHRREPRSTHSSSPGKANLPADRSSPYCARLYGSAVKRVRGLYFNFTFSLLPHQADLGGAKLRGIAELGSHANAQMAINNLDSWAADEQVMQF